MAFDPSSWLGSVFLACGSSERRPTHDCQIHLISRGSSDGKTARIARPRCHVGRLRCVARVVSLLVLGFPAGGAIASEVAGKNDDSGDRTSFEGGVAPRPSRSRTLRPTVSPLACPTGSLSANATNFSCSSSACSFTLSWNVPTGAAAGTIYDIFINVMPNLCTGSSPMYLGSTTATQYAVSGLPTNSVYLPAVVVDGCSTSDSFYQDSLPPSPAPVLSSATVTGPGQVTLSYPGADGLTYGVSPQRAGADGVFTKIDGFGYPANCPIGSQKTYVDSNLAPGSYNYRLAAIGNQAVGFKLLYSNVIAVNVGSSGPTIAGFTATPSSVSYGQQTTLSWSSSGGTTASIDNGVGSVSLSGSVALTPARTTTYTLTVFGASASATAQATVNVSCPVPGAPTLSSPVTELKSGQSLPLTWTAASGLVAGGTYVVETSPDGFAKTISASLSTSSTSAVIPTSPAAADVILSARVRAVQGCQVSGANSNVVSVIVRGSPASFLFTKAGPSWSATQGSTPPFSTLGLRNVGGQTGTAALSTAGGFFSVDSPSVTLGPGEEKSFTIRATPTALASPGSYNGLLVATYAGTQLSTPVSLSVVPSSATSTGAKAQATTGTLTFKAAAGASPAPQSITVNVAGGQGQPVYLTPSVFPGGSWLVLSNDLANPVPASGQITLPLGVNRLRRTAQDGVPPLRSFLRLTPLGGDPNSDAAVVEILDTEPVAVAPGAGTRNTAATSSFLVPVAVKQEGSGGAVFTSDGWLRNQGASPVSATLYFTPDGVDGLRDSSVLKSTLSLPPSNTYRLSDLIAGVFGTKNTSGQIELRSSGLGSLSLRTTVDSVVAGDPSSRYGTEIPTVGFGAGVGMGDPELVLPGIDDDALYRANLILAETTGFPATVLVTVTDSDGKVVGTPTTRSLPPYGKTQINRLVAAVAPGTSLSGGWASLSVTAGAGKVTGVATVIDNRSGSFSAVLAKRPRTSIFRGPGGIAPLELTRSQLLGTPSTYVIPTSVRNVGRFDTRFSTRLTLVNGTAAPAELTLSYHYVDQDDGGTRKVATSALTLKPRASLADAKGRDAIANLFGVTHQSYGYIVINGDVDRVTGSAAIESQVDPNDPTKGSKAAPVNGKYLDEPEVMGIAEVERGFEGAEKSDQFRTNLILLEVGGQPCTVLVRLYSKTGEVLKERSFAVDAEQYFQVNDIFGDQGVALGDGPFADVHITARVVSGTGRILALATVVDNVSRNPKIHILGLPGPPSGGIGF